MKKPLNTKEHIVQTFIDILSKKTVSGVSIQDICKCAFISRRAFYNYFDNLEQLADFSCYFIVMKTSATNDFESLVTTLIHYSPYINKLINTNYFNNIHRHLTIAIANTVRTVTSNNSLRASAIAFLLLDFLREGKDMSILNEIISLYHTFFGRSN